MRQEPRGVLDVADEPAVGRPVDVERPEGHQAADPLADDPRWEQQPQGGLSSWREPPVAGCHVGWGLDVLEAGAAHPERREQFAPDELAKRLAGACGDELA